MDDYFDLGSHSRPVSTTSVEAQRWFDRGLVWCYGFNHEESVRCFQEAVNHDPNCAMAHWGIAYAAGCNYNKPWEAFDPDELAEALVVTRSATRQALACLDGATVEEQALIEALDQRYQSDQLVSEDEFVAWNDAYAAAMRSVYARFPDDLDVAALFAEALINRTPWQLWDLETGESSDGADTLEALDVLERGIAQFEQTGALPHPGLLHIYVHTVEMSPHPERGLRAADLLRDLVPDAGHLLHMPSHIDILCGQYYNAVVANSRAIEADMKYLAHAGAVNFYTLYRCHDYHFKLYSAMFLGQYGSAIEAANDLVAAIPNELLAMEQPAMADWLEGFISMKMHVLIRFGRWQEIIAEPLPVDRTLYSVTTAMIYYAKTVAYAATGHVEKAEVEKGNFEEAFAAVPESRYIFNNQCRDILAIAAEMLRGELEYRKGNYEQAFAHLRRSIQLDDSLPYDEPWGWMQPTRHALGALLLEQDRIEEAEAVYRADLGLDNTLSRPAQHPENVWSLHGYVECLQRQGKDIEAEAAQARLDLAQARADVEINASCFCRLETHCCH